MGRKIRISNLSHHIIYSRERKKYNIILSSLQDIFAFEKFS